MKSMTGYGRADFSIDRENFAIEIKSLNHRFLEIDVKLTERFLPLELRIREETRFLFSRGSVKVSVRASDKSYADINVNIEVAKKYLDEIERMRAALDISGNIDIGTLINFRDIFTVGSKVFNTEEDWRILKQGLNKAAADVLKMREDEGAALSRDILNRLNTIERVIVSIEGISQRSADIYAEKIKKRMQRFLKDVEIDETRLLNEVAIFSDRSCIDEEIIKLKSHISIFKKMFNSCEPAGRKMDFLCQEILRELNTIASKAQDIEISHAIIDSKTEIEKVREQVQNVE